MSNTVSFRNSQKSNNQTQGQKKNFQSLKSMKKQQQQQEVNIPDNSAQIQQYNLILNDLDQKSQLLRNETEELVEIQDQLKKDNEFLNRQYDRIEKRQKNSHKMPSRQYIHNLALQQENQQLKQQIIDYKTTIEQQLEIQQIIQQGDIKEQIKYYKLEIQENKKRIKEGIIKDSMIDLDKLESQCQNNLQGIKDKIRDLEKDIKMYQQLIDNPDKLFQQHMKSSFFQSQPIQKQQQQRQNYQQNDAALPTFQKQDSSEIQQQQRQREEEEQVEKEVLGLNNNDVNRVKNNNVNDNSNNISIQHQDYVNTENAQQQQDQNQKTETGQQTPNKSNLYSSASATPQQTLTGAAPKGGDPAQRLFKMRSGEIDLNDVNSYSQSPMNVQQQQKLQEFSQIQSNMSKFQKIQPQLASYSSNSQQFSGRKDQMNQLQNQRSGDQIQENY